MSSELKWDGAFGAMSRDKQGSEGFLGLLFAYLDKHTDFFADYANYAQLLKAKTDTLFESQAADPAQFKARIFEPVALKPAEEAPTRKWDGIFGTLYKETHSLDLFLNTVFAFLGRKSDFFNHWETNELNLLGQALHYFQLHKERKENPEKFKLEEESSKRETRKAREGHFLVEEMKKIMATIEAKRKEKEEEDARKDKEEGEVKERGGTPYKCGGVTEKYIWNQTLVDMIISIPMPSTMTKDKINVKFTEDHCHVSIKGEEDTPILNGKWHDRIDVYETIWTLEEYEGNKVMNVFLSKFHDFQVWWDCVCEGEPKIDTGKVQPEESNMQYMDDDIKAEVDKAMYDQRQRALGLPTIEQQQNQQKMYLWVEKGGAVQEEPVAETAVRRGHARSGGWTPGIADGTQREEVIIMVKWGDN